VESRQQYGVDLYGPTRGNAQWQAREGGFTALDFRIDWAARKATCPIGRQSRRWNEGTDSSGNPLVWISFARRDCEACLYRLQCTRAQTNGRTVAVRPQEQHTALVAAREREKTEAFRRTYAQRAGVEGTVSQSVSRCDL